MRALLSMAIIAVALTPISAYAVDVKAAEKLVRDSDCNKCHAVSKKKEGPSFRETAEKYRGKPDAEQKIYTHITTQPVVKVEGKEEKHERIKTDDEAAIRNLIQYILSR